jgi:two-component system response regulator AtoC
VNRAFPLRSAIADGVNTSVAIARVLAFSSGGEIGPEDLAGSSLVEPAAGGASGEGGSERPAAGIGSELTLREQLDAVERGAIARAMAAARGNQSEAARQLGMSRGTLIDRLRRYGIGTGPEEGDAAPSG